METRNEQPDAWEDAKWDRLVKKLRSGNCTPFLGAGASSGAAPLGAELSRQLAERYGYPFKNDESLGDVAQYVSIMEREYFAVKADIAESFRSLRLPDFSDPSEPHALLSRLPISVFLTTNYDDFMWRALRLEGKSPVASVCPWYRGAGQVAGNNMGVVSDYQPDSRNPLIYHLHGRWDQPETLVLAEQDYVEFLVNLTKESYSNNVSPVVPFQVLPALTQRSLLFIGYSLSDWSFRTLFYGIVRDVADIAKRRHISVQLAPEHDADPSVQERKMHYLDKYFDKMDIDVYWGEVGDFCRTLTERLGMTG